MNLQETIIKINNKYRLVSKSTGRNLGTFDTKEEAEKREQQVQFFKHKNEEVKMSQEEQLEEKTLTPNEMAKREEIVKSLKKKQSDFVKRYGADRAKAIMYAVATKTAKAVTEESDKKYKVSYDFYGSNKDVPLYSKSHNVSAKSPDEAVSTLKKLVGGRNHKAEEIHESEISDKLEKLNPYKTKKQIQREHLEQTGEFLSLSEINLDERIEMPQGHKYSADPITKASENGQGRKKPQMGSKANTAAVVAAILKKTKE